MKTSVIMDEIRKIRDENSQRHLNMTSEELSNELKESLNWFVEAIGNPVNIVETKDNRFVIGA